MKLSSQCSLGAPGNLLLASQDGEAALRCDELMLHDAGAQGARVCERNLNPQSPASGVQYCRDYTFKAPEYVCMNVFKDAVEGSMADHRDQHNPPQCPVVTMDVSGHGISASQRAMTVDKMIAGAGSLGLSNNALFLAVACLDRYLGATLTCVELLQPLSVACLWIAAKYDAAAAPRVSAFVGLVTDLGSNSLKHTAAIGQLLVALEASALQAVDYRLASMETTKCQIQSIFPQLQTYAKAAGPASGQVQQQQLYCMMSYLAEVSLLEYQLLPVPPSQLAAASCVLAHVLLGRPMDADLLVEVTGYTLSQLQTPLQYLCALHTTLVQALMNGKPYAVSVKYSVPALHAVAYVAPLCDPRDPRLAL